MKRLARFVHRRRRPIVAVWIGILLAAFAVIIGVGDALTTRQELPGSESVRAAEQLSRDFGLPRAEPIQVVIEASSDLRERQPLVEDLVARLRRLFPAAQIDSPYRSATGASGLAPDGRVAYVNIPFDDQLVAQDAVPIVKQAIGDRLGEGIRLYTAGAPSIQVEIDPLFNQDLARAEAVAIPASLIVLALVLGTVFAAIVPLLLTLFVIPTVLAMVFALSHLTDVTVYATNVVSLIGLGIAIDYSLLVVYRFREELNAGHDVPTALERTMQTAVRAVIFSGVTVGIGLGVLLLVRVPFVQSFGIAGVLIPIVTIAAALSLLPALLAMIGTRINRWRLVPSRILTAPESGLWRSIANGIMRAPAMCLIVGATIVLAIAAPVRDLALGASPLRVIPNVGPAVAGSKLLERTFGGGGTVPVRVFVERPASALVTTRDALAKAPGVTAVKVVQSPRNPRSSLISVYGTGAVGSERADRLVGDLRSRLLPAAIPAGTTYLVGGGPAIFHDFQDALYGDFAWIALIVIVATYLVLFRAFRSLLLPLKAVAMNLLSVAGAYGLLVAVFQHGVGADLFGFERADQIAVWIPLFLFAFLFGLSMDYEVFLLARMREEHDYGASNRDAIANGLAKTGKLITSAAVIMVIAFGGLAGSRFIEMQEFGFGLAAAILLDATLIRALIVPSLMKLMGRWNWWLPAPLQPLAGHGLQHETAGH